MPTWHAPPKGDLSDVLSMISGELSAEVAMDPTFEKVTGISTEAMSEHAIEAVTAFFSAKDRDLGNPTVWAQVYVLGFVVGMKYGESKQSDHMKGKTDE